MSEGKTKFKANDDIRESQGDLRGLVDQERPVCVCQWRGRMGTCLAYKTKNFIQYSKMDTGKLTGCPGSPTVPSIPFPPVCGQ